MATAPLRIQTRYSARRSIVEPADVAAALKRAGYDAGAIVDRGVLFGFAEARSSFEDEGIALVAGAEVVVRFSRPGGGLPPPAYVLTVFPETIEGLRALSRLLEKIWRSDRPERIRGTAEWDEFEGAGTDWIVGSGGLAGPFSGALARGRIGDARRLARTLAERFGPERLFLEVTRGGSERERVALPFLAEIGKRYGLRRLAADPVPFLEERERPLWERVLRSVPPSTSEDPTDSFADEIAGALPSSGEWARRYEGDPEALRSASEIVERCRGAAGAAPPTAGERETDELIRIGIERMGRRYADRWHTRRKEIEARFWDEFWRIEGAGRHRFALRLSRIFKSLRSAESGAEIRTNFLAGSVLGYLLDLQEADPVERGFRMGPVASAGSRIVKVEADRRTAARLRKLVDERLPGETFPLLVAESTDPDEFQRALALPLPGEDTGPKPHPPTASPSGVIHRGNRGPVPLPGVRERRVFDRVVAGYRRDRRTLLWTDDPNRLWNPAAPPPLSEREGGSPAVLLRIADSLLLGVLRETRNIAGETRGPSRGAGEVGRPREVLRRASLAGLVPAGMPPFRDLLRVLPPDSLGDLTLILATAARRGTRFDLLERIASVRAGNRPPPLRLPAPGASLDETGGVPFFREQLGAVIRHLAGYDGTRAEGLLETVSSEEGPALARERALFLRRAADRGESGAVASRFFSLMLALAPDAPSRGEFEPLAASMMEGARRKSLDPAGFAAAALSERIGDAKSVRGLAAAFRREGVSILPLHRNRSAYRFLREGERVRAGLGIVRGMTAEWAARFEQEREVRGEYRSGADLLERLAARRFPRPLLLALARAFDGGEEERGVERSPEWRGSEREPSGKRVNEWSGKGRMTEARVNHVENFEEGEMAQEEAARERSMERKRPLAREEAGSYGAKNASAERRGPSPRRDRSRRADSQTAFSFFETTSRRERKGGRRSVSRGDGR